MTDDTILRGDLRYSRGTWATDAEHSDAAAAAAADAVPDDPDRRPCGRCNDTAQHAWFPAVGDVCTLSPLYSKAWIRKPQRRAR